MTRNGADNSTDRETGAHWEAEFCRMARRYGKFFTPHQFGHGRSAMFYGGDSQWTLPDITIWSAPGEHHEIKHKRSTQDGMYGLERYRLDALIRFANTTGQQVFYTIHDWEMAGADDSQERVSNDPDHWLAADIATLSRGHTRISRDSTYYNGILREVEVLYWTADPSRKHRWFVPLPEIWQLEVITQKGAT